jgi:dipeptidyl aminopeptidase/acylaminoacyl peptidase
MLGTLDGKGDPEDPDPVNRESAKPQCVVARAAPSDFLLGDARGGVVHFVGMRPNPQQTNSIEYKTYREASPVYHVSPDDPPFLLLHGDADETVPYQHSERMEKALREAGVTVKLLRVPGGGHGPTFPGAKNPPDYLGEMVRWLDRHLRAQ